MIFIINYQNIIFIFILNTTPRHIITEYFIIQQEYFLIYILYLHFVELIWLIIDIVQYSFHKIFINIYYKNLIERTSIN